MNYSSTRKTTNRPVSKARILVVDDHPVVLKALADMVGRDSNLICCGEAASVDEAREAVALLNPDLILLDLWLGCGDGGLEFIKYLSVQFPSLLILVLSQHPEKWYADLVLVAGARGYLTKDQTTQEILQAIRTVLTGGLYLGPNNSRRASLHETKTKRTARMVTSPV